MTITLRLSARTAMIQGIITDAGASAKLKLYNGTKPASLGAPSGTLLATLTFGSVIGAATGGTLDWDEAGASQTNSSHVAGTPTFARLETSGGAVILDIDIGGTAPKWDFTGAVATGQNVTLTTLVFTAPHA